MNEVIIERHLFDSPWSLADAIMQLDRQTDRQDKHYKLKLANLIKGYTHAVISDENSQAIFRTYDRNTKEDFEKFFQERVDKHGPVASEWFSETTDGWKLKHHYFAQGTLNSKVIPECTSDIMGPCLCWKIDTVFKKNEEEV